MIEKYELFFEGKQMSNNNLIKSICVGMLLINPEFLDKILDKGIKGRYINNTTTFISDLKLMVTSKNRLSYGKLENNTIDEITDIAEINSTFDKYSSDFDIEKNWSMLKLSRELARTIQDKLLFGERLTPDMIERVYWINEGSDINLAIKTKVDIHFISFKSKTTTKSKSFNTIIDIVLGDIKKTIYSTKYSKLWDSLTRGWVKTMYENLLPEYKVLFDDFFDYSRVDSITYDNFYDIEIQDKNHKRLGKFYPSLGKNYKQLHKLLSDLFKTQEAFKNYNEFLNKWNEIKKELLYSRILEDVMLVAIERLMPLEEKEDDSMIIATETLKMRLLKLLVELLGSDSVGVHYVKRDEIVYIPSKKWFRSNFDNLKLSFDFHTKFTTEDKNFKIRLVYKGKRLLSLNMDTNFSGGEMSGNLSTKYSIDFANDFNQIIKGDIV